MRARNWLFGIAGPVSLALLVSALGCNPDATPDPNITPNPGPSAPAFINLVHTVTDLAGADLYVDSQKQAPPLNFRAATGNLQITPGAHLVELRPTGSAATDKPLLSSNINVLPGSQTLLVIVGKQSTGDLAQQLQLIAAPYGTPDSQNVKLRMFNAVPDSPTLDMAEGNSAIASGVSYGTASAYSASPALSAATKFGLRPTHTAGDLAFLTFPVIGTPGSVVTVIALGEMNPVALQTQHFLGGIAVDEKHGDVIPLPSVINDAGPAGSLYLFQGAADAPPVDLVDSNNVKLATGLAYLQATPLISVPAGESSFTLRNTGTGDVLLVRPLHILPGQSYALIAEGLVAKGTVNAVGLPRPAASATSWRLVHAVPDGAPWTAASANMTLGGNVAFGETSAILAGALPAPNLSLIGSAGAGDKFNAAVSQMVLDAGQGSLTTVITTGSVVTPGKLAVLAVIENTANAMMAPSVMQLTATPVAMLR